MAARLERDLVDLYGVPPQEFIAARNALVARLRKAGRAADAAHVARLRKPSVSLWAVNQVARRDPDAVRRLMDAVDRLKRAHFGGTAGVATATDDQRAALHRLVDRAKEALEGEGLTLSPDALTRLTGTLLGAAVDPKARRNLLRGDLETERQAPGFEALSGAPRPRGIRPHRTLAKPTRVQDDKPKPPRSTQDDKPKPSRSTERVIRAEAHERSRQAKVLERKARQHTLEADRAARAADQLRDRLRQADQLRERLRELEQRARAERDEADRASRAAREVRGQGPANTSAAG